MPTFAYEAVDGAGRRQRGEGSAASAAALTRTLEDRGLLVLELAEPLTLAAGEELEITLKQNHDAKEHVLGRVRLGATTDVETSRTAPRPPAASAT